MLIDADMVIAWLEGINKELKKDKTVANRLAAVTIETVAEDLRAYVVSKKT